MSVLHSPQRPSALDRTHPPPADVDLVVPGQEFEWGSLSGDIDVSDLECHPLLASDLPLNSDLTSLQSTALL
jgi:hypothetical protein